MIILAIDPGIEKLGYAYFEKKTNGQTSFKYLTSGMIKTSKKEETEVRLKHVFNELSSLINENKPDLVVFEQIFFFKNAKTVIKVSQAQGVILLLAGQNNIPVKLLTPLQIKQIITGYGNADKKSVQKMLPYFLKQEVKFKDDDQSDAVACGLAYCYLNEKLI